MPIHTRKLCSSGDVPYSYDEGLGVHGWDLCRSGEKTFAGGIEGKANDIPEMGAGRGNHLEGFFWVLDIVEQTAASFHSVLRSTGPCKPATVGRKDEPDGLDYRVELGESAMQAEAASIPDICRGPGSGLGRDPHTVRRPCAQVRHGAFQRSDESPSVPHIPYAHRLGRVGRQKMMAIRRECDLLNRSQIGVARPFVHDSSRMQVPEDDSAVEGAAGKMLAIRRDNQFLNG